ncbi:nitroreductase family protein [Paenibacillus terreus]|uniref:Nitroreductase family protein n=1 Tax=Paenibacillus terreus TaxID=1387834 RepID=A0ABV5B635_9BACL
MKLLDRNIAELSRLGPDHQPVPEELVLKLLNHAVWAPNHRLREPWRFIFVPRNEAKKMEWLSHEPGAHLIIVSQNDNDPYKQSENTAAVFCLVQNFQLLAYERGLGVNVIFREWMYDSAACRRLGVMEKERITAVLELGFGVEQPGAVPPMPVDLNWSRL